MIRFGLKSWPEMFPPGAPPLALQVKNCLIDSALTPLIGSTLCVDRLFYNPNKFIRWPGEGSPLFTGGVIADGELTLPAPPRPTLRAPGRSVLIGSVANFGHFIINHLPRLAMALDLGLAADHYIVGPAPEFVFGFFEAVGIDRRKVISVSGDAIALVESLTVLPMQCCGRVGDETACVQESYPARMRACFGRFAAAPRRRLYFPRGGARWRRLLNEAEIVTALHPLGFELYLPEQQSIAAQLTAIGAAEAVVGPGGAAINLAAFAPTGAILFELRHQWSDLYGDWADIALARGGVGHEKIIGAAVGDQALSTADFTLDPALVVDAVTQALDARSAR